MYTHARDWAAAARVAEAHEPDALADVTVAQARARVLASGGVLASGSPSGVCPRLASVVSRVAAVVYGLSTEHH